MTQSKYKTFPKIHKGKEYFYIPIQISRFFK